MEPTLSLAEASKMAGASITTLRRWAQSGTVKSLKGVAGWSVDRQSLMDYLSTETPRSIKGAVGAAPQDDEASSSLIVSILKAELAAARQRVDNLERDYRQALVDKDSLHRELNAAAHEMRAYLEMDRARLEASITGQPLETLLEHVVARAPATPWWRWWRGV